MAVNIKTIKRPCFCCGRQDGFRVPLGVWSIAGIGDLDLNIRICDSCGAVLQDPVLNEEAMGLYYKSFSNYTNASRNGLPSEATLEADFRQVATIQKYLKPGWVFEVGSATANLLSKLKKLGWAVDGCDPSQNAADVAAELWDIQIKTGLFEDLKIKPQSFDLVVVSHVLEHVYDPLLNLLKANEILSEDGCLLVEVPCLTDPEKWPAGYFTFEHINIFSKNSLINCLLKSGFEPLDITITSERMPYPVITILSKKTNRKSFTLSETDSPDGVKRMIQTYRESEVSEWNRIDQLLSRELIGFERVIIWGAGIHTSQLFENVKTLNRVTIRSIIDSDPQKRGLEMCGVKISDPVSADLGDASSVVVISSRASENEIYNTIYERKHMKAKIIRLYQR